MNRRAFLRMAGGSALALGGGIPFDAFIFEPHAIQVTSYPILQHRDTYKCSSLKIAFMSDFHRSMTTSRQIIQKAVRLCQAEKPDVLLLGGDYISSESKLISECAEDLSVLSAPQGIYFVLGNHDHVRGKQEIRKALTGVGFVDLTNRNTKIGQHTYLCGIDDQLTGNPEMERAFLGTRHGHRLVFSHNPLIFPKIRQHSCVVVCGHTHGGQINIPFVPNPNVHTWQTYLSGWFREGNSSMYVNRGIGMLSLPLRFRCRPEITLFTIPET